MSEILSAAAKSLVQEPIKHATNALGTGTGVTAAPDGLNLAIAVVGLCVAIGIGFKTYLEIRTQHQELSNSIIESQIKKEELAGIKRRSNVR